MCYEFNKKSPYSHAGGIAGNPNKPRARGNPVQHIVAMGMIGVAALFAMIHAARGSLESLNRFPKPSK